MRSAQRTIALAVIVAFYLALVGPRAAVLIQTAGGVGRLVGITILLVPVPGVLLAWREARFGQATQRLTAELEEAGWLPPEPRPGSPVDHGRAQLVFAARRLEVDAAPLDWRAWYRLGLAYEAVGQRRSGRAAMRHAIALHNRAR